jgi:hypothetical protein
MLKASQGFGGTRVAIIRVNVSRDLGTPYTGVGVGDEWVVEDVTGRTEVWEAV